MMKKSKNKNFGITSTFEGILYYLSAMIGFNIIYALKILGNNINDNELIPCHQNDFFIGLCILIAISIIIAFLLVRIDDSAENQEKGMSIYINPNDNRTSEIFFNSYSMFVITALSLPNFNNLIDIVIYFVVFITMGKIYVSNEMFYINPTISLLGYRYYEVISTSDDNTVYTLMAPKDKIKEEGNLNVKKKNGNIIKLR